MESISSAITLLQASLTQPLPIAPASPAEAGSAVTNPAGSTLPPATAPPPPTGDVGSDPALPKVLQRLDAITTAINGLQPAFSLTSVNGLAPIAPANYKDDQAGIAAINLVPELARLKNSWTMKPAPSPDESKTEAGLTNKLAGWNDEIRSRRTIVDTLSSKLKDNELAIGESSRKLDENTVALSKANFNLSWAKTNNNDIAESSWRTSVDRLSTNRATLIRDVRQKQDEAVEQVRQISFLKNEIAARTLDVDLATAMISLIRASAPIPGPPLP